MSTGTEIAPARPRTPTRATRKRDERIRRIVRRLRHAAPWLESERYSILLRSYAILALRVERLHAENDAAYDELGNPHPTNTVLAQMLGKLASIGARLGLDPIAEKLLKYDVERKANWDRWIKMAEETVDPEPAAPASAPTPENANGVAK